MLYLPSKLANPKLVNQSLITSKNGRKVKPINNKTHAWRGAKKRKRGLSAPKNKHVFKRVEVWVGLREKETKWIAIEIKNYNEDSFSLYKIRNKYSILYTPTGQDVYQYPCRLFGAHKTLHNKGVVEGIYKKLLEIDFSDMSTLLPYLKATIISLSKTAKEVEKAKKKAKK